MHLGIGLRWDKLIHGFGGFIYHQVRHCTYLFFQGWRVGVGVGMGMDMGDFWGGRMSQVGVQGYGMLGGGGGRGAKGCSV